MKQTISTLIALINSFSLYAVSPPWLESFRDAVFGKNVTIDDAENLSQCCAVSGVAYAMANGLDVDKFAKNALALNSRNAAAQYLSAARWVFAPAPLNNLKKGIEMMMDILVKGDMEKDDRFNVNSAIGYAYVQQKKYAEARPWLLKSLEIYPSNKFAAELLEKK
jgi:tetratricopeptide (TPR) repeat protein